MPGVGDVNIITNFASNLSARRKAAGLGRRTLGKKAGWSATAIRCWERGIGNPSLCALDNLAEALGCAPADLLANPLEPSTDLCYCATHKEAIP